MIRDGVSERMCDATSAKTGYLLPAKRHHSMQASITYLLSSVVLDWTFLNTNTIKDSKQKCIPWESFEVFWSPLESFEVLLSPLESSGVFWSPFESSGVLWSPLESSGVLWSPMESSRVLENPLESLIFLLGTLESLGVPGVLVTKITEKWPYHCVFQNVCGSVGN